MIEKVAVLMGGTSAERDISLLSGQAVFNALKESGINAYKIDTATFSPLTLKNKGFTKAFIALHGRGGEDGSIQAILESLVIPYTGSGVKACAIAMDKWRTKLLWQGAGLPVAPQVLLNRQKMGDIFLPNSALSHESLQQISVLGSVLFIKPNTEGSSLGASRVDKVENIVPALKKAFHYDDNILIEPCLEGPEYTVGIVEGHVLPSIRIKPKNVFYDYSAKYFSDDTGYLCPSGLDARQEDKIKKTVFEAWQVLGGRGWGRVDLMMHEGDFYLLEANMAPGMTTHSLVPMAAKHIGISFSQLVLEILAKAQCDTKIHA